MSEMRQATELMALGQTMQMHSPFRSSSHHEHASATGVSPLRLSDRHSEPTPLQIMKTKLVEMCQVSSSIAAMDEALTEARATFGDAVQGELASLSIHRIEVVEAISFELLSLQSSSHIANVCAGIVQH